MAIRFDSTDSINNFFNTSLGKKNNQVNLFDSINLNDYNSLKTGTYKKLLKSYYDKAQTSDTKSEDVKDKLLSNISSDNSLSKDIVENTEKINKATDKLKEIEYEESNRNTIVNNVTNLVSSYNNVLDAVEDSKDSDIATKGKWMTNYTKTFKDDFSKIGVEIGEDNRLSINEETLKNASLEDIEALFVPKSSFGNNLVTISGVDTYL